MGWKHFKNFHLRKQSTLKHLKIVDQEEVDRVIVGIEELQGTGNTGYKGYGGDGGGWKGNETEYLQYKQMGNRSNIYGDCPLYLL